MKRYYFLMILFGFVLESCNAQTKIVMRMDDMGMSHGVNIACIEGFQNGLGSSVEVMVPGPWFEEAAEMLNENPTLDVGVHLTLSCEWESLRWRPLTKCPSLVDEDGYFLPMIWPNSAYGDNEILKKADWKIEEVEKELRAQIELALKRIPHISHLSQHMGCLDMNENTKELFRKLGKEYGLKVIPFGEQLQRTPKWGGNTFTSEQKEKQFLEMLNELEDETYVVIGHLALDNAESRSIGHRRIKNIAQPRSGDLHVYTSEKVAKALKEKRIQVISYKDL